LEVVIAVAERLHDQGLLRARRLPAMRAELTDPLAIIEGIIEKTVPLYSQQQIVIAYFRRQQEEIDLMKKALQKASMLGES
jgi:hypothetical protein